MKKKTRYYIDFPSKLRLPVTELAVIWLLIDRMRAPQWVFISYWIIALIVLACQIYYWCTVDAKEVDIKDFLKDCYLKTAQDKNKSFEKLKKYLQKDLKNKEF